MTQPDNLAALRADRDAWQRRAVEAERIAESLADELARARAALNSNDAANLSVFDDAEPAIGFGSIAADGSDRAVLPLVLAAMSVVALLVAGLAFSTRGIGIFPLLSLVVCGGFAYAAWNTRVLPVSVTVSNGVVTYVRGDDTHRYDLSSHHTGVDVRGKPGDADWRVRLTRRGGDPIDVDSGMVDPTEFMGRIDRYLAGR